jgi:hypothetical protein
MKVDKVNSKKKSIKCFPFNAWGVRKKRKSSGTRCLISNPPISMNNKLVTDRHNPKKRNLTKNNNIITPKTHFLLYIMLCFYPR